MILIPIIIIVLAVAFVLPTNETWGIHLVSGALFTLLTIGLLDRIIAIREKIRREPLRKEVVLQIGLTLRGIFEFLRNVIAGFPRRPRETRDEFYNMLQELAERNNIELSDRSDDFFPQPGDSLSELQLYDFFESREELRELGVSYSDVLEPSLCASLLSIRDNVRIIRDNCRLVEKVGVDFDFVDEELRRSILAIFKEIQLIRRMNIPLYDPRAGR